MQMSKYLQRIHSSIGINIYTVINDETEIKKLGWIGIAQANNKKNQSYRLFHPDKCIYLHFRKNEYFHTNQVQCKN